jgi:hypothetical protein
MYANMVSSTQCCFCETRLVDAAPYLLTIGPTLITSFLCLSCGWQGGFFKYCVNVEKATRQVVRQFYYLEAAHLHIIVDPNDGGTSYFTTEQAIKDQDHILKDQYLWLTKNSQVEITQLFQMISTFR